MDNKTAKQPDWLDQVSVIRMSCLTSIGRTILPPGFWGDKVATASGGKLYLTFDDGPNPDTTPHLLKLLAEEKVPATFFLIGEQITRHKQLGKDIVDAGHTVGNHSFKHEFMPGMPSKRITEEIHRTNDLLREISPDRAPRLFRPPFGILDRKAADCARAAGLSVVYWTIVPEDWEHVGAIKIVERVSKKMSAGSIIVLHEGSTIAGQTIESTRQIIKLARDKGFEFSALPELEI
jgi:peptidoglycan/xylan/chitin deacetylase (PgdA/CDA1 family)